MPELPDVTLYVRALNQFIVDRRIEKIELRSPFVLRTIKPDLHTAEGLCVVGIRRLGKKIVWELDQNLFLVFHLMIAGRFHWRKPGTKPKAKTDLMAFQFEHGVLMFTEASAKKRAALYVLSHEKELETLNPRGLEVLECDEDAFR